MAWEIEYADEFGAWWESLNGSEQASVEASVRKLSIYGPLLGRPDADTLYGSNYSNMKELRIQHEGRPYRILFAFDPRRTGMLLIGGDKTGNNLWYEEFIPKADAIYEQHLKEIEKK